MTLSCLCGNCRWDVTKGLLPAEAESMTDAMYGGLKASYEVFLETISGELAFVDRRYKTQLLASIATKLATNMKQHFVRNLARRVMTWSKIAVSYILSYPFRVFRLKHTSLLSVCWLCDVPSHKEQDNMSSVCC